MAIYDVTIIIPAYLPSIDYVALLNRAVLSIANQKTNRDMRVIVVLNGCDDCIIEKALSVIHKYESSIDITHIIVPEKIPCGVGRQVAFESLHDSSTRYIALLDADDEYFENKIEEQCTYMDTNPHIDLSFTSMVGVDGDHTYDPRYADHEYTCHDDIVRGLNFDCVLTGSSLMIRYTSLKRFGGFLPGPVGLEDYAMWKKMVDEGYVFGKIPKRLYKYSLTTTVPRN